MLAFNSLYFMIKKNAWKKKVYPTAWFLNQITLFYWKEIKVGNTEIVFCSQWLYRNRSLYQKSVTKSNSNLTNNLVKLVWENHDCYAWFSFRNFAGIFVVQLENIWTSKFSLWGQLRLKKTENTTLKAVFTRLLLLAEWLMGHLIVCYKCY